LRRVVLDASVAAKWYLPIEGEPYVDHAFRLFDTNLTRDIKIEVPDLFWAEMGNILWKATRANQLTRDEAREALDKLIDCNFPTTRSSILLEIAFGIATSFGRSIYDCFYIALAESSGAEFVTADEKLVNSLAARCPIKWIGTF
jgi:predicted nucleic acid-binding protein